MEKIKSKIFITKVPPYPLLLFSCFYCFMLQMQFTNVASMPEGAMDAIAMGAMQVAGTAMEFIQNGAAIHKERGVETPFLSVRGKTDVGFGDAMRNGRDDSSSEESGRRRRKRAAIIGNEMNLPPLFKLPPTESIRSLHRIKRAPCQGGGGGGGAGADGDDDDAEVVNRRAGKRKAAKSAKSKKTAKKSSLVSRKRRQAMETNDLAQGTDDSAYSITRLAEQAQEIAQRMCSMWESVAQSMHETMQQVQRAFEVTAQTVSYNASAIAGNFPSMPTDAEYVNV